MHRFIHQFDSAAKVLIRLSEEQCLGHEYKLDLFIFHQNFICKGKLVRTSISGQATSKRIYVIAVGQDEILNLE